MFSEPFFLSLPPSGGVASLLSSQSHIPFGLLFNFQGTVRRSFTCSHWEEQNYRVFLKNFLFYKRSLHSFGQRGAKCTPIFEIFQEKFFIYRKYSLTYLELQSQMTPYFTEKNEKIFFGCGCFILLAPKTPFTYSHWEKPNAHPKSQKIFYPFTYLELRSRNAPCFYKNFEKYFLIEGLDFACSKSPFTYSHWEEANSNPVSKNILLFAKPLHLFGIRRLKRNLFFKKTEKIF